MKGYSIKVFDDQWPFLATCFLLIIFFPIFYYCKDTKKGMNSRVR